MGRAVEILRSKVGGVLTIKAQLEKMPFQRACRETASFQETRRAGHNILLKQSEISKNIMMEVKALTEHTEADTEAGVH